MTASARGNMHVLLVEDSQTMRSVERAILVQMGFTRITEAVDGAEGLDRLEKHAPDLILVDRSMPRIDGVEFVRQARARGCEAPIIMVTTESSQRSVVEAIKAGVDHYVVKPFTPDLLCQRIEEALAVAI